MDIISDGPILTLTGEVDVRSTGRVRDALHGTLAAYDADVTLDVSEVDTIDLTALRVVAAAGRIAARPGQHVVLRGAGGPVLRLLHLTRLIRFVEVERTPVAV